MTNNNYKQTQIGEIPEEWGVMPLGKLIDIKHGYAFKGEFFSSKITNDVLLKPGNVAIGGGFQEGKYKYYNGKVPEEYVLSEGDIFVNMTDLSKTGDTLGYSAKVPQLVNKRLLHNQRLGLVEIVVKDVDKDFIYWKLRDPFYRSGVLGSATGTTVKHTSPGRIKSIQIAIPKIDEQHQIASILSSLDDKIELNRRMNKTLEEMGKAFFNQLATDSESSKKVELKDIVDINPTEQLKRNENTRHVEMKDLPEQGMWVSSEVNKPYKGGSKFRNGDTLMARITPCLENGKSAFVSFLPENELAFGSTEFIVLRPKNKVFKEYVYYLVRNDTFRDFAIKSMVGSSGRQRVQTDAIQHYQLSLPLENLVDDFHTLMKPVFQQIKTNSIENEKLSAIRDSLLPRLMSGKLKI